MTEHEQWEVEQRTPGHRLYIRWLGLDPSKPYSELTDRARYYLQMNAADVQHWERLAADLRTALTVTRAVALSEETGFRVVVDPRLPEGEVKVVLEAADDLARVVNETTAPTPTPGSTDGRRRHAVDRYMRRRSAAEANARSEHSTQSGRPGGETNAR